METESVAVDAVGVFFVLVDLSTGVFLPFTTGQLEYSLYVVLHKRERVILLF